MNNEETQAEDLPEFIKVWHEFGVSMNLAAKRELGTRRIGKNKRYGEATGTLRRSLSVRIVGGAMGGTQIFYVNGTIKKHGSPYSYGSKAPPIAAIREWMKVKPVRLRDKNGQFIEQTEARLNSAAFGIAQGIKKNGIVGVKYYERAYDLMWPRWQDKLYNAMQSDIETQMMKELGLLGGDNDNIKLED